jgi:hypothetical protein
MIPTGIWTLLVRRLVIFTYTMAWLYLLDGWYNSSSHESSAFFFLKPILYTVIMHMDWYGTGRLSLNARALRSRFPGSCGCHFYYFCCSRTSESILQNYPCQLWNYPFFRFWPDSVKNVPIFFIFIYILYVVLYHYKSNGNLKFLLPWYASELFFYNSFWVVLKMW